MTPAGSGPAASGGVTADRVQMIAAAAVTPYQMLVDAVGIVAAGSRRIVRIALDRDLAYLSEHDHTSLVPPLDLDGVADASRAIDEALEGQATALFGDRPYLLEVGSAGAERQLTLPRHFRLNVGRLADVTLVDAGTLVARIVAAGPDQLTLRPEAEGRSGRGRKGGAANRARSGAQSSQPADLVVGYPDLQQARIRVEFGRAWDEPLEPSVVDEDAQALSDESVSDEFDRSDEGFDDANEPGYVEESGDGGIASGRFDVVRGSKGRDETVRPVGGLED